MLTTVIIYLVTFLVITFLVTTIAIRLFRAMSGWRGFKQVIVGRTEAPRNNYSAQQGYITLRPSGQKEVKTAARFRSPERDVKAPWGW